MHKGIVLFAFGKKGYLRMAHNLAYSIRHFNPTINITLFASDGIKGIQPNEWDVFSRIITIPTEAHTTNGKNDPAKVKAKIYHYGATLYEHFLYLDVDAVALTDPEPLLDHCIKSGKGYLTEVMGKGGRNETVHYSHWATNETIWRHFNLTDTATLYGIQSSWAYFSRTGGKELGDTVLSEYQRGFPLAALKERWGGTLPDELLYQGATAMLGIDPTLTGFDREPMFFGNKTGTPVADIKSKCVLLSVYGNGGTMSMTKIPYTELYDNLMRDYKKAKGQRHEYKLKAYCMEDKHANLR